MVSRNTLNSVSLYSCPLHLWKFLLQAIIVAWTINEPRLPEKKKAGPDVMRSHLVQDVFQPILSRVCVWIYLGRAWVSPTLAWLHCARVCIYISMLVCLDRPLTVTFKWAHSNISRWWNVHADMYFSKQLSKAVKRAWRATVRLQGRCEREWEWRRFKLNALAACTATLWTMVWVWRSCDKASYEWP